MTSFLRAARWILGAAVAFALVTWVALEGGDVSVLRTHAEGASWRSTHVWTVEGEEGALWVEAATPERPWLEDVRRDARVEIDHDGTTTWWSATPVEGEEAHAHVRALLREKYGWADRWVGLLQDTSQSIAVRLDRTR